MTRRWRVAALVGGCIVASLVALALLSRPGRVDPGAIPDHRPDLARGEVLYRIGGCFACHQPRAGAPAEVAGLPAGGSAFPTPVGTFFPGNLTPDRGTGLGEWSAADFVDAMARGVSPDGRHYFPAFPYTSYAAMPVEDLLDLWGYLQSLPAVSSPGSPADVPLRGLARRGVGAWKRLAFDPRPFTPDPGQGESWNRGAYLVNAPGHCGECHTPRNVMMIPDRTRALAGGPHPAGEGKVPSLLGLSERERYRDVADLVLALQFGETFGYDKLSSGGMAKVQEELSLLPEGELRAIAEYLMSLPAGEPAS